MGALAEQHEAWVAARARLYNSPPLPAKRPPPRPPSPFAIERPHSVAVVINPRERVRRRLFTAAIEELDEYGDIVVPQWVVPTWKRIAIEVAAKHGVPMTDLLSQRRNKNAVLARHECFWRCKQETLLSLPQIGRLFKRKDHTTVLHGIRKHEQRMREAANG
jgi:hypothetical protein